jgi:hypothetical protein
VTVTAILFSLLLVAVQQTASGLGSQVNPSLVAAAAPRSKSPRRR